jgi:hypothetical protein
MPSNKLCALLIPLCLHADVIVSKPKSDFALRLIRNLASWNKFLFVK